MPRKPRFGDTQRVELPSGAAEHVWLVQLRPIWNACAKEPNPIMAFGLACYMQGAMDAQTPEYRAAVEAAK